MDKARNFIGWLWVDNINLSDALIREGCAEIYTTASRSQYFRVLQESKDEAQKKKLRWAKGPPIGVVRKFEEPAQVSSTSTDHGSKLRATSRSLHGRSGLVVRSRPRGWRVPGLKPDSTEELPCKRAWCTPNLLQLVWCGSLEREEPAQVLSPSSDHGSKLRGPSQNSPRVASKRDVNKSKLTLLLCIKVLKEIFNKISSTFC
ncbi:hypothetical protein AVEN_179452-1 [Araneus ventricosus]|uniref:TNase-like domain-containing protein n=1 Tax=Araneus ventricosus TaxID=182803 RepID=A0A4Y2BEZ4_ARAVE|nr:hypothetical protein AVEN_179452-1 [Araneus ventricosus]